MELFDTPSSSLPFKVPSGDGYAVRWQNELNGYQILVPNGELFFSERYFDRKISDRSVEFFQENDSIEWREAHWKDVDAARFSQIHFKNIRWMQDSIKLYGKVIPLPRLTAWYGDPGKVYTYSGIKSYPNEWNKGLSYLKSRVEECAGVAFNSVLLNWYRDGTDYLNWHADDEPELGRNPIVASANFGAERDFVLRRNDEESTKITLPLGHGTLLIMKGELQHFWQHSVPKRSGVASSRFNLTFRRIGVGTQNRKLADK